MRRITVFLVLFAVLGGLFTAVVPAAAGNTVGQFETDGNLKDDSGPGDPIDWSTPPPHLISFNDVPDVNTFGGHSKESQPSRWSCVTKPTSAQKDDILSGNIASRTVNGKQFIYVNFFRRGTNGSADLDYEFNQSTAPNPACPDVPQRTPGDIVIAFDVTNGGKTITVRAFKWQANNTFQEIDPATGQFDGATNIPTDPNDPALNGVAAGAFGEAVLNVTDTIGTISCGQFASVYMKARSSFAIDSDMNDRTTTRPALIGDCPTSNLAKAVRNVTTNGTFAETATASPGDTLEYRLTYTNTGALAATNVVVTDDIATQYQTYVAGSCTKDGVAGACTTNGPPVTKVTWSLGTVQPNAAPIVMTFRVTLASQFPANTTTHVKNTGVVDSSEEQPKSSNETDTSVNATVHITSRKTVSPTSANVGDKVHYTIYLSNSGNQAGTTNVTDNYDENHLTVSNITGGGTDSNPVGTITWTNVSVPANSTDQVKLEYDAVIKGSFSGDHGTCDQTQFPVVNSVTLSNGGGSGTTLCVNGQAVITSTKSVTPAVANEGDTVTYTIKLSNSGNIPGTITVTDDYDEAHLTILDTGGATDTNGMLVWSNVVVPVGTNTVTLTYTAQIKVGSFTGGTAGGSPCTSTQFKVHNTVTLSSGSGTSADLCVNGHANVTVVKSADRSTGKVGDQVHYSITLTNNGNIAGAVDVTDDYDQDHITPSAISNGGVDNGNTITWTNISVPAGGQVILTYAGTIKGTFSGDNGSCQPGQFPVVNTVTISDHPGDATVVVTGTGSSKTICVTAAPDLHVLKSADKTQIGTGGTITYTLAYSNNGDATATNVVITDSLPNGTTFVSCTGGCDSTHLPAVTWNIGTVAVGGTGSVTLTVRVTSFTACQICNVATIASTEKAAVSSNQLCVNNTPAPNPAGARASGDATGANVFSSLLGLDLTLPNGNDGPADHTSVDSAQSGVGSNGESNQVLAVNVPPATGSVLHADVLKAQSTSTVTSDPARSSATSVGSAANVDILNGTVTATLVRGIASAETTGTSVNVTSLGSAIEGLKVLGIPQAVYPGARVDLPPALFGAGSYVAIYEEQKATMTPPDPFAYSGDITVNMIRVHVTNMAIVGAVEVVVGHAKAHADFPPLTLCGQQASQSVSGHALMASLLTDPSIAPVFVGAVGIPPSGGAVSNSVNTIVIDPVLTSRTATSNSQGSLSPLNSTATSSAEVKSVCLLNTATGCTISARLVRAQANSTATSLNRTSDAGGTDFLSLKVASLTVALPVPPNTVIGIPGVAVVILNEQFCDNGATLASNCDEKVTGHTGITVRAIHVILLDAAPGGVPGADLIVAEAHSDARFV